MAELLIRPNMGDVALMERVLAGPLPGRPSRLVIDAVNASRAARLTSVAAAAGTPVLIDPQTHLLQDHQYPGHPWVALPFGQTRRSEVQDFADPTATAAFVAACLEYQMKHGATALVAPYLHLERGEDDWAEVQARMWQATQQYLSAGRVMLPLVALVALNWRVVTGGGSGTLDQLLTALDELAPTEVALAASKIDAGTTAAERLLGMLAIQRNLSTVAPVIAWQQGVLGEVAVAAGAAGYECGIGWRERCSLWEQARSQRRPMEPGPRQARAVFVAALRRSIPKRTVGAMADNPAMVGRLACMDPACCPQGAATLLLDSRQHTIRARRRILDELVGIQGTAWRWGSLAAAATDGLDLARRINNRIHREGHGAHVDATGLQAIQAVAQQRQQETSGHSAA